MQRHGGLFMPFIMANACHGHYLTFMPMIKILQPVLWLAILFARFVRNLRLFVDIQQHLIILLKTIQAFTECGLEGATKTLITAMLMKTNEQYIRKHEQLHDILDASDSLWGCGKLVNCTMMSCSSWHKLLYVGVHIGYLDLHFHFRPFDSHYKVHRRYCITSEGSSFFCQILIL